MASQEIMNGHDHQDHDKALERICRLCCQLTKKKRQKNKRAGSKAEVRELILEHYDIDIHRDISGAHPENICGACYDRLGKLRRANHHTLATQEKKRKEALILDKKWFEFQGGLQDKCQPCQVVEAIRKAGKGWFRPLDIGNRYCILLDHVT